jgi:DNA mismatch repair protein MutS2
VHAEGVLEFESLRALLARYLRTPLGHRALENVTPLSDRAAIENALAETSEALDYARAASHPQPASRGAAIRLQFESGSDPGPALARLRIEGAVLDGLEIYELTRLLDFASELRAVLTGVASKYPRLGAYGETIADLREVARDLRGKVLPDGSLSDDASVALARLRREIEKQRRLIEESLTRFLRAHHQDGTLQENFVTIRDDRFVVPIVTGKERKVDGVIHGSSGSGATAFVEPLETIQLNNELVRLHEEELREIHRLLREFTGRLRTHAKQIAASAATLAKLELLFAKAEFGLDFQCTIPSLSPDDTRQLNLKDARHPLLEDILRPQRKHVVPVSLTLEGATKTLLISGPNTGGKTVALKAVGLLALMTHAGLPVPANEAEFPLFDNVLADIGDHQSLEHSLSSFSAHIMSIKSMLETATSDSLVLIDELGRATDPEEGGALGIVVLESLRLRGAFTLASTHLTAMKVYGASTAGVLNGSMGFDDATLAPTYVLRLGAPGKSAGLDIASRLGLPPELIGQARARMTSNERDIAQFIARLNAQLEELEDRRKKLAAQTQAVDAREKSLEQTWEKKYAAKICEVEQQASALAAGFEQKAHSVIEELSRAAKIPAKAQAHIAKTRREYQESVEALTPASSPAAPPRLKLEPGARVRLKGVRQPATIRRMLDSGQLEVEAGFLKMQIPQSDVEEVLTPTNVPTRPTNINFHQGPSLTGNFREINLIGQRAEEACDQVDKLLDSAALAQVDRIRIVHGHGMGILKRAIADLLKTNPHVEKFYVAAPEEGGTGATIVELK